MVRRGEIWWAELSEPTGSAPGYRRPVLIIQANEFNDSRIRTVVVVAITSNLALAAAPGNVLLLSQNTGLSKDSVANISQIVTIDKQNLSEQVSNVGPATMREVDLGLRLVLGL